MLRLLALIAWLIVVVSAQAFVGQGRITSGTGPACLWATYALDGCANAPAYVNATQSYQKTNMFTDTTGGFFQSGQTSSGVSSINWNVAGKDFAVGIRRTGPYNGIVVNGITINGSWCNNTANIPCSTVAGHEGLIAATTYNYSADAANWGCSAGSGVDVAHSHINCGLKATGDLHIQGIDFNDSGTCYSINITNPSARTSATIELSDFYMKYTALSGTNGCINSIAGGGPIRITGSTTTPTPATFFMIVDYFIIDQDAATRGPDVSSDSIFATSQGPITVQYGACLNANARCVRLSTCGGFNTSYNVSTANGYWPGANHFEFGLYYPNPTTVNTCASGALPNQTIKNQVSWTNATTNSPASTANISLARINAPATQYSFGALDLEYNILGYNKIGGASTYFALGEGPATVANLQINTGGSGYTVGDIVSINDGCSPNAQGKVATVSGGAITNLASYRGGVCGGVSPPGKPFTLTCVSCAGTPVSATVSPVYQNWTGGVGIDMSNITYTGFTVAHNRIDPTGLANPASVIVYGGVVCPATGNVYTDNFNLSSGAAVTTTGSATNCPTTNTP